MGYLLLITFIAVPIIEIALFIQVGSLIGLFPTLGIVVLTAVAGTWLIRQQGFAVLTQARRNVESSEVPVEPVIHGIFLLIAGLLLLTPGFFTDAIGFACLIPPLRLAVAYGIWDKIKDHVHVVGPGGMSQPGGRPGARPGASRAGGPVIDGEVIDETPPDPGNAPPDPNSPWSSR
ncbi:MAG: FxsA family protein [Pseudomonadota bacterium]